jgi:hypothetical protein
MPRRNARLDRNPRLAGQGVAPLDDRPAARLEEDLRGVAASHCERVEPTSDRGVVDYHGPRLCVIVFPAITSRPIGGGMSLAERKKDFVAVRTARGLVTRKLFEEKAPGALREAVLAALAGEAEKERTLDEEARRMMEGAKNEIASGRVDGQELFRRIRRKLAEQRGIVL